MVFFCIIIFITTRTAECTALFIIIFWKFSIYTATNVLYVYLTSENSAQYRVIFLTDKLFVLLSAGFDLTSLIHGITDLLSTNRLTPSAKSTILKYSFISRGDILSRKVKLKTVIIPVFKRVVMVYTNVLFYEFENDLIRHFK